MAVIDVLLPQFGMGMQDGEIISWLKAVGDTVLEGDPLVEIEAAKTTVEMPSPASGTLTEILAREGDTIEVRTVIARISP
jgi:pyruvate/2-oxoglutarate dehydrogenase complex dihydrolipoamide acyltransferase (E2) component